jgi:hypothetical protein
MAKRYNGAALFLTLSINVEDTTEKVSQFIMQMKLMRRYQLPANATRDQCYKSTAINYHSNFNPTFSRVKMMQYNTAILG